MEETSQESEPPKTVSPMPPAKELSNPVDRLSSTSVVKQPPALVKATPLESDKSSSNCKDSNSDITPSTVIIVKEKVTSNSKPVDKPNVLEEKDTVEKRYSPSPSREIVNNVSHPPLPPSTVVRPNDTKGENGTGNELQNWEPVDLSLTSKTSMESEKTSKRKTPSPVPQQVTVTTAERRERSPELDTKTPQNPSLKPETFAKQTNSSWQNLGDALSIREDIPKDLTVVSRVSPEEGAVEIVPRKISPTPKLIDRAFHSKKISPTLGKLENVIERIKPSSVPVNNEQNADLNVSPVRQNETVSHPRLVSPPPNSQEKLVKSDAIETKKKSARPEIHEKANEPRKASDHIVTKHTKVKPGLENIVARLGNVPMNSDHNVAKAVRTISYIDGSKESGERAETSVLEKEEVKTDATFVDKNEKARSKDSVSSSESGDKSDKTSSSESENDKESSPDCSSTSENIDKSDKPSTTGSVPPVPVGEGSVISTEKELPASQKHVENVQQKSLESKPGMTGKFDSDSKISSNVQDKEKIEKGKNTETTGTDVETSLPMKEQMITKEKRESSDNLEMEVRLPVGDKLNVSATENQAKSVKHLTTAEASEKTPPENSEKGLELKENTPPPFEITSEVNRGRDLPKTANNTAAPTRTSPTIENKEKKDSSAPEGVSDPDNVASDTEYKEKCTEKATPSPQNTEPMPSETKEEHDEKAVKAKKSSPVSGGDKEAKPQNSSPVPDDSEKEAKPQKSSPVPDDSEKEVKSKKSSPEPCDKKEVKPTKSSPKPDGSDKEAKPKRSSPVPCENDKHAKPKKSSQEPDDSAEVAECKKSSQMPGDNEKSTKPKKSSPVPDVIDKDTKTKKSSPVPDGSEKNAKPKKSSPAPEGSKKEAKLKKSSLVSDDSEKEAKSKKSSTNTGCNQKTGKAKKASPAPEIVEKPAKAKKVSPANEKQEDPTKGKKVLPSDTTEKATKYRKASPGPDGPGKKGKTKKVSQVSEGPGKVSKARKVSPGPETTGKSTKSRKVSPAPRKEKKENNDKQTEEKGGTSTIEHTSGAEAASLPSNSQSVDTEPITEKPDKKLELKPTVTISGDTAGVCKMVTVPALTSPEVLAKVVKSKKASITAIGKEKPKKSAAATGGKVPKSKKSALASDAKEKAPKAKKTTPTPDSVEKSTKGKKSTVQDDKEKDTKCEKLPVVEGVPKVKSRKASPAPENIEKETTSENAQKVEKPKKSPSPTKRKVNTDNKDSGEGPVQKKKRTSKKVVDESAEKNKEQATEPDVKPVKKKKGTAGKKATEKVKAAEGNNIESEPMEQEAKDTDKTTEEIKTVKPKKGKATKAAKAEAAAEEGKQVAPATGKKGKKAPAARKKKQVEVEESDPDFVLEEETTDSDISVRPRIGERHSERQSNKKQSPSPRRGRSKSPKKMKVDEEMTEIETEEEEIPAKKGKKTAGKKKEPMTREKVSKAHQGKEAAAKGGAKGQATRKKAVKKKSSEIPSSDTEIEESEASQDANADEAQIKTPDISQKGRKRTPKPIPEDEISPEVKKKKRKNKKKMEEQEGQEEDLNDIKGIEIITKGTDDIINVKPKVPKSKPNRKVAKKSAVAKDSVLESETESENSKSKPQHVAETDTSKDNETTATESVENSQESLSEQQGQTIPKETEPSGSGSHAPPPGYVSDVYEKPSSNQGSVTESQIDYSERLEDQEDELLSAKIPIVYTGTAPKTPPPIQPHQAREDMKLSYGGTVPQRVSNIPLQAAAGHEDGDQDSNNSSDTIDYNPDEEAPPKIAAGSGLPDPDSRAALEQRIMAELAEVSKPRKKRKANRIFQCSQCSFVVSIYQHINSLLVR